MSSWSAMKELKLDDVCALRMKMRIDIICRVSGIILVLRGP